MNGQTPPEGSGLFPDFAEFGREGHRLSVNLTETRSSDLRQDWHDVRIESRCSCGYKDQGWDWEQTVPPELANTIKERLILLTGIAFGTHLESVRGKENDG